MSKSAGKNCMRCSSDSLLANCTCRDSPGARDSSEGAGIFNSLASFFLSSFSLTSFILASLILTSFSRASFSRVSFSRVSFSRVSFSRA
jgi:uncharacterized protein YjbI with pentapeptide repeats